MACFFILETPGVGQPGFTDLSPDGRQAEGKDRVPLSIHRTRDKKASHVNARRERDRLVHQMRLRPPSQDIPNEISPIKTIPSFHQTLEEKSSSHDNRERVTQTPSTRPGQTPGRQKLSSLPGE